MNLKDILKAKTNKINAALKNYIPDTDNYQKLIYEAMSYSLFAGGKRLRPMLMMMVCEMCGKSEDICVPFAAAMEMIHTYSLIHDDLPAMDNDDYRRGRLTNHKVYGEATAVLAGDALLNRAFEVVSEYAADMEDKKAAIRAMSVMARASGCDGMIGGQVVDMEGENEKFSIEKLRYTHSLKTGAIIRASAVIGAVIAGADEESIKSVDAFAENLGIAFQICDDILDVEGDAAELGKPIGSDAENGKNTYVSLLGMDKSKELVKEYSNKAIKCLDIFGERAEELIRLTEYLTERRS